MQKMPLVNIPYFLGLIDGIENELIAEQITKFGKPVGNGSHPLDDQAVNDGDILLPDSPEINQLLLQLTRLVQHASENQELALKSQWAVSLKEGRSVGPHSHHANYHMYPEDYWSAVYYPVADESSAPLILSATWCNVVNRQARIQPQTGMYVIFPAYVQHWTSRQTSSEPRLVIGANFDPAEPNTEPNVDFSIYDRRPPIDTA
jgi:hypothetical protein